MRQVKHFCRRETAAYHLYFWLGFLTAWKAASWAMTIPGFGDAIIGGIVALKAAQHVTKPDADRHPRHAPEP